MKRMLPLLLACLLLLGCGQGMPAEETDNVLPSASAPATDSFPPVTEIQEESQGLQTYLLPLANAYSLKAWGSRLLLLSGDSTTTLTLLQTRDLAITASLTLDFYLDAHDPGLQLGMEHLSYYDPAAGQTVVLDETLKEISHIRAPEGLVGSPLLSSDRNTLYYCTATAIRSWNLETGIRRMVKALSYEYQALTGLHQNDSVVQCTIQNGGQIQSLFVDVDNGRLQKQVDGQVSLTTQDGSFYASFPTGGVQSMVFAESAGTAQLLLSEDPGAQGQFLPQLRGAVFVSTLPEAETTLTYCDLTSGARYEPAILGAARVPLAITGLEGSVYLLSYRPDYGRSAVTRWEISVLTANGTARISPYSTEPDTAALAQCQQTARKIGDKYGLQVLVWKDATAVQPWDYDLEPEYQVGVIQRELELLDARLSQYPQAILTATASHFTSLNLCLVRQLTGTAESGSLERVNGLQFFDDGSAYVVLAVGRYSDHELYHELFHVMETHILSQSAAFDRWEEQNPSGFSYDYSYRTNAQRDSGVYLSKGNRAFIDTYSMSYPSEDRARIMEYAMLPGNASLFQEPILQAKLATLCKGIRDAYGLKKSTETYHWEQYLK